MRRSLLMVMVAAAPFVAPSAARACGACVHGPPPPDAGGTTESTVVTGHRMAVSISKTQTVLWDQIEYVGNPEEFAWVLPVKPGAHLELARDAWFEVLEAGTTTVVGSNEVRCPRPPDPPDLLTGCGSSNDSGSAGGDFGSRNGVQVVSQGTVGPYETVTLSTEVPGALNEWLDGHGYVVPEDFQPTIDSYVEEGFDFIALRLIPGNGVNLMQPVRVHMPPGEMTLPLRMVAGGTGAMTAITLFVIGEGRYEAQNFDNLLVDRSQVVFSYDSNRSNFRDLRKSTIDAAGGMGWLTAFALPGALTDTRPDRADEDGPSLVYNVPDSELDTFGQATVSNNLADLYLRTAGGEPLCVPLSATTKTVVDNCSEGRCEAVGNDELSKQELLCGTDADDFAEAVTGMRLGDVWVTRLEAELPREAFGRDLVLHAADDQSELDSRFIASVYTGHPCGPQVSTASMLGTSLLGTGRSREIPGGLPGLVLSTLGIALVLRRRGSITPAP